MDPGVTDDLEELVGSLAPTPDGDHGLDARALVSQASELPVTVQATGHIGPAVRHADVVVGVDADEDEDYVGSQTLVEVEYVELAEASAVYGRAIEVADYLFLENRIVFVILCMRVVQWVMVYLREQPL